MDDDRPPLTPEALDLLLNFSHARPTKVDCIEIRCHPDDEAYIRAMFDAPIVVDAAVAPGTFGITPFAYAKHIDAEIGFAQPPASAGREQG